MEIIEIARTVIATGPNSGTTVVPTIPIFSVRGEMGIVTTLTKASSVMVKFLVCWLSIQTPRNGPPMRPFGNLSTRSLLVVAFPTRTKLTDLSFVFTEELIISLTDEYWTSNLVLPSPASLPTSCMVLNPGDASWTYTVPTIHV